MKISRLVLAGCLLVLPYSVFAQTLPNILLIDDDDNRVDWSNNKPLSSYFTDALEDMGFPYTVWSVVDSTTMRRPDTTVLRNYDLVIWDQPDYYAHQTNQSYDQC